MFSTSTIDEKSAIPKSPILTPRSPLLGDYPENQWDAPPGSPLLTDSRPKYEAIPTPTPITLIERLERPLTIRRLFALRWKLVVILSCILGVLFWASTESGEINVQVDDVESRWDLYSRVRELQGKLAAHFRDDDDMLGNDFRARALNQPILDRLAECLLENSCQPGEMNVVILASFHFGYARTGYISGEDIWALSSIEVMTALNYTMIYTFGHMDTLLVYEAIPELVKTVIWETETFQRCLDRNEFNHKKLEQPADGYPWQNGTKGCIKKDTYPQGIPIWKSFVFHFWTGAQSPLGRQWTLAPEDYSSFVKDEPGNFYLGYQIVAHCGKAKYYQAEERSHQALVLAKAPISYAKGSSAFYHMLSPAAQSIPPALDPKSEEKVPFEIVSTTRTDMGEIDEPGLHNLGRLPREEWLDVLARSKVMLGLGKPVLSPSPYGALCVGVPFINPITKWDPENPDDRMSWVSQQDALNMIDEPYVYHVRQGDEEGLRKAMKKAVETPIDRFIPPNMTFESVMERHRLLVESDWLMAAKVYVEENYDDMEISLYDESDGMVEERSFVQKMLGKKGAGV